MTELLWYDLANLLVQLIARVHVGRTRTHTSITQLKHKTQQQQAIYIHTLTHTHNNEQLISAKHLQVVQEPVQAPVHAPAAE